MIEKVLKYLIWAGTAVIIFSPLYLKAGFFFPFIFTKTITFNVVVEIIFLAFLFLAWRSREYKIKINIVVVLFGVYLLLSFLSSFLGDNFYHSFWSNNERGEGLLLYLHLFVFLIVLTSFFKRIKDWLVLIDLSFLAGLIVSLFALAQYFEFNFVSTLGVGGRLSGTIGNAGYLAGYLIFTIFFGLLLLFYRKNVYLKFYYLAVILLEIFIAIFTETRGGMLALAIGGFIFSLYLLFFYFKDKRLKWLGGLLVLLAIILPILLFVNKESNFVKNNRILARVTSVSLNDTTTQNRLMTWNSSWQGYKEKPILGWGQENFYQVFDQNFNPAIYRHKGSVIWFDRAHNIVFSRMVTGGVLGLLTYLSFLFVPLYFLWRLFLKDETNGNNPKKYLLPVIFSLVVLSHFIQNLFIFETLVTYIPLFISLALIGSFLGGYKIKLFSVNKSKIIILCVGVVLFFPIMYFVNIRPFQANIRITKVLNHDSSVDVKFKELDSILALNTYGNYEYRQQYFNFFHNVFRKYISSTDQGIHQAMSDVANKLEEELNKQIAENPNSTTSYLLMMKFNNLAYAYDINRLNNNFEVFKKVEQLSPTRAQIYSEMGQTYLNLGLYGKKVNGDVAAINGNFDLAEIGFKKAISLNDQNLEPYRQFIYVLMAMDRNDRAVEYAEIVKTLPRYGSGTWADDIIEDIRGIVD